uniref:TIL domain-containing protein n=1 Tax=Anopheles christyi TaxID=43041 RepID=A0A182KDG1_9DIPT
MKSTTLVLLLALVVVSVMADNFQPWHGCRQDEEFSECTPACSRYCFGPLVPPCNETCVEKCVCRAGYVRKYMEGGECVRYEDCLKAWEERL